VNKFTLIFSKNGRQDGVVEMQVMATDSGSAEALGDSIAENMEGGTYYCQKNSCDCEWNWGCEAVEEGTK
jgi:hypothetical protein